ncbi:MAG: hypothetical protein GC162_12050 [Planctomycetes bacterium]|nr:hypothetical protein [Planctomycetota bacterium]
MKRFPLVACAVLIAFAALALAAENQSLLPQFGPEGGDVAVTAQNGHKLTGWLPKDWVDNSEWAGVSGTYTKLDDPPKPGLTAINIKVSAVDDGQLQLTTWTKPTFKKGVKYVVEGYIRSKSNDGIKVVIRQPEDPYEFYADQDLEAGDAWKAFSFEFTLDADKPAFVMFVKPETGSVDLSGIVVREAQ